MKWAKSSKFFFRNSWFIYAKLFPSHKLVLPISFHFFFVVVVAILPAFCCGLSVGRVFFFFVRLCSFVCFPSFMVVALRMLLPHFVYIGFLPISFQCAFKTNTFYNITYICWAVAGTASVEFTLEQSDLFEYMHIQTMLHVFSSH